MKHPLPPLDSLKVFEAAARNLSFSKAADELCISKGAVSYQIRKLEEHLQCTLFKRAVRQVYLTDAGQVLLQSTRHWFSELGDTLLRLGGESRQAEVTIAATTYVAARWLSPRVSEFNDRHPHVTFMLRHSVNSADFKLAEVDLAILWGPCGSSAGRARLAELPMALYPAISPQLLARHGIDAQTTAAATRLLEPPFCQLPLLCEDRRQDLWQAWFDHSHRANATELPNPRRTISDANVRVQAAIDGQGMILADELMRNELNNKLLVAPFTEQLHGYGYAVLAPPSRLPNNHAQLFKRWLASRLR